jgi:hypothetical protein
MSFGTVATAEWLQRSFPMQACRVHQQDVLANTNIAKYQSGILIE